MKIENFCVNMFEKLKQIKKLQEIQGALKNEKVENEKNGVKILMNGKLEVEDVQLNPDLSLAEQEKAVRDCINDAMKKVQMVVARKMQSMGMGGFGM
ncbi:MAG TPA: YbaB/EbfC family nucleoid-associated protein [Candidatus Pacearchaeota archaeon]|nr:YbaB/EbfC family nucleoid-associated protein [Candidatus Pacearchaeota archaeon]